VFEQNELKDHLNHLLGELPEPLRAAVVMVDVQEYDYGEAAAALGIPIGTLKSRLARGRVKLRSRLVHSKAHTSQGTITGRLVQR
jgi:RNA polymerase sigma-70 factor, ECF subfamily